MTSRNVLTWFNQKCPYPKTSQQYKDALRKLDDSTYRDRQRLNAEFEAFESPHIPVEHYSMDGEHWIATIYGIPPAQQNLKGIQQHGSKWRVERRVKGKLERWTAESLSDAISIRDRVFGKRSEEGECTQEGA
jgi:hypothetical protein